MYKTMRSLSLALVTFFSLNTFSFESTYLICGEGSKTTVIGLKVGVKEKAKSLVSEFYHYAKQYIANKEGNDFIKRYDYHSDAYITEQTITVPASYSSSYTIDRYSGTLTYSYQHYSKNSSPSEPFGKLRTINEAIGECNSVSETRAKQIASSIFLPQPEKKKKF